MTITTITEIIISITIMAIITHTDLRMTPSITSMIFLIGLIVI